MKFQDPEERQVQYREAYLRALDSEVPEVFEALSAIAEKYKPLLEKTDGKVFGPGFLDERFLAWQQEIYEERPGKLYAQLTDEWDYFGINAKTPTRTIRDIEKSFIGFVSDWQSFITRYYLGDGWIESQCRITLRFRYKFGDEICGFRSVGLFQATSIWTGKPIEFTFPGMRLNTSERAKTANHRYKKAAINAFKAHLDQHIVDTDNYFKNTLRLDQYTNPHKFDYVGWLARWNVNELIKSDIEEMIGIDRTDLNKKFVELERIG